MRTFELGVGPRIDRIVKRPLNRLFVLLRRALPGRQGDAVLARVRGEVGAVPGVVDGIVVFLDELLELVGIEVARVGDVVVLEPALELRVAATWAVSFVGTEAEGRGEVRESRKRGTAMRALPPFLVRPPTSTPPSSRRRSLTPIR